MGNSDNVRQLPGKDQPRPSRAGNGKARGTHSGLKRLGVAMALGASFLGYAAFEGTTPALSFLKPSAAADPGAVSFSVTDGDTIRLDGARKGMRLVGFNAPEKRDPLCERERQLGERATQRLRELVATGRTQVTQVGCACQPGTEGTDKCNYGRSCGILRVNGRDVGEILISEGLAVPFVCEGTRCPATPKPWC